MEALSYKLEVFEGPMDLLLHLISKHKIDINDIYFEDFLLTLHPIWANPFYNSKKIRHNKVKLNT